ncbi:MAG: hypothetical protein RL670_757, partial [Actinomycetota bacterium]
MSRNGTADNGEFASGAAVSGDSSTSPFIEISRTEWAGLAASTGLP